MCSHSNVKSDPDNEKFRKLRTANKTFSTRVWLHGAACDVMKLLGWKEVDDLVVLTDYDEEAFDVALKTLLEYIKYIWDVSVVFNRTIVTVLLL